MPWAHPAANKTLSRNSVGAFGQFRSELQFKWFLLWPKYMVRGVMGRHRIHTQQSIQLQTGPSVWMTAPRVNLQTSPATPCLWLRSQSFSVHPPPPLPPPRWAKKKQVPTITCRSGPRAPACPHLPIPVARVAGNAVVEVPVGQRLLFIEDKLLQLHLHFCAGHRTWCRRKQTSDRLEALARGAGGGRGAPCWTGSKDMQTGQGL